MIYIMFRVVVVFRFGSMVFFRILKKVVWFSMLYIFFRNIMMEVLCVGISFGGKLIVRGDELLVL